MEEICTIPKVLKKILISTKNKKFFEDYNLKLCFENFAEENLKICELLLHGNQCVENGEEWVLIREVSNWKDISSRDILFQMFLKGSLNHRRMFRVNFNMFFVK